MPITFQCPHCQARMSVPDQMAGKRGKCSKCKGPVAVPGPAANGQGAAAPAPAPTPHGSINAQGEIVRTPAVKPPPAPPPSPAGDDLDLERAAADALADQAQEEKTPELIEFNCPQCDEPVKLGLDLGGKKHPCPHCRRIISVPVPKPSQRTSWRDTGPSLPSGARRDTEPAPVGAWGTGNRTGPSEQTLRATGVITAPRKPLTLLQRLRPYLLLGFVVLLAGGGWFGVTGWLSSGRQKKALAYAQGVADSSEGTAQVGLEGQAALNAYAGRYFLRRQASGSASKAAEEFRKVVARVEQARRTAANNVELDALLVDTAPTELRLAGSREEVQSDLRRPPAEVQKMLRATLAAVRDREARLEGLRRVTVALIAEGEAERIRPLTLQLYPTAGADQAEALATAGLELLRAGKKGQAEDLCRLALQAFNVKKDRPELRAAVVALAVALGQKLPERGKSGLEERENAQAGEATGLAWSGQASQARQEAGKIGSNDARFRALLEIADHTREASDIEAALKALNEVRGNRTRLAWAALRLVGLGQKAGLPGERLEQMLAAVPAPLNGWAQLALLREHLASSRSVEAVELVDRVDRRASPLAHEIARVELAWHNTYLSAGWGRSVDSWDEASRPFGSLGVALGMQGKR